MQIPCPGCGEQLPLSDELLGKKIRCGGCQRVVDVPTEIRGPEDSVAAADSAAPVEFIQTPEASPASAQPADNVTTMLVDCACGNRSCVPTSSSGSELRCPSCHRMMRIPNPPAPRLATNLHPGGTLPATPPPVLPKSQTSSAALGRSAASQPYRVQPKRQPASNLPIIITAVSCLVGLALLIGTAILVDNFSDDLTTANQAANTAEEPANEASSLLAAKRVAFQEGYSMSLPVGCEPVSREQTDRGYIVYRFRNEHGLRLTIAIIPSETFARNSKPPQEISQTSVKGVSELNLHADTKVTPTYVVVDRMRAAAFRFYEKQTYSTRFTFTYRMVAMDEGRKLVLNFHGMYGDENSLTPPQHWYDSLLTLRREGNLEKSDAEPVFDPKLDDSESKAEPDAVKFAGNLTLLDAGYAINVPQDFQPLARNAYRGGEIRYEFRSPAGTLKIRVKPSQHSNPRSIPPVVLEDPPGDVEGAIVEVGGRYYFNRENVESVLLDGMTSCLCRVDHAVGNGSDTKLRGYFLIAMDEGKEVYLEMTGEMKGPAPESWRACAMSLKHHADVKDSQMPAAFQSP
jgi:hypothetical protein